MPEKMPSPQDQMMQWITSKWITKPLYVIAELGIADLMCDGPKGVDDLAKQTETHAPTLYRLLRALASVGVFIETEGRVFGPTPLSQCLLTNAMRPMARMFLSGWHDRAWDGLGHTVRTGQPGFDDAFGQPAFEWFEANPSERSILDQAQASKAVGFANAVMESCDFSAYRSICDVGGGQGAFLIRLLLDYPDTRGYVAELPGAVGAAEKAIAEAGLSDRCKAIAHDFHTEAPPICDAYFLVNVLHDWNDDACNRILKHIAGAMDATSRLWIIEYIIAPGPGFCVAKLLDLEVLVMGGGRERTIDEYKTLLGAAGLKLSRTIPTGMGLTMMECLLER